MMQFSNKKMIFLAHKHYNIELSFIIPSSSRKVEIFRNQHFNWNPLQKGNVKFDINIY